MSYKDPNRNKEYNKAWYESHKEQMKEYNKAWKEANKEQYKAYQKEYQKAYQKAYSKSDVNTKGQTKSSIRLKSRRYLSKYGKNIEGYQIHHCCSYTEPYKFIYCSRAMHKLIHAYLRQHNINADSDHYDYIKHLLDESVVLYGLER